MSRHFFRTAVLAVLAVPLAIACESHPTDPASTARTGAALPALRPDFSSWGPAINIEQSSPGADPTFNTPALDGCPFVSRDGKSFYMASTREGGLGGIDIWVSTRASTDEPWGPPVNVGAPVNSSADDFCPTLDRDGTRFFFVSRRVVPESCGGADIYATRRRDDGTFEEPVNLGCNVNSAGDEASPFPMPGHGDGPVLYFSSNRPGLGAGSDIYTSKWRDGSFAPAQLVPGINSVYDDAQPNVRHDGLEIFFYSTRPDPLAQGGPDIYSASRPSVDAPWSTPVNLGPQVNSKFGDTRPSLSWDGTTLYFGSNRAESENGSADIYVTQRTPSARSRN